MDLEKRSVIEELDRINASSEFRDKPVMQKMLAYLVNEYVEGRSDQIKGYSIGLDVFGQGSDFDPARTALVRNNAMRLRGLLKTYYLGDGQRDPVRIDIPKGRYVPHITRNNKYGAFNARAATDSPPAISVLPFSNLSSDPAVAYLANGFSQALSDALTKFDDLRVVGLNGDAGGNTSIARLVDKLRKKGVGFVIDGDVQHVDKQVKISFRLIHTADDSQLWTDSVRFDVQKDDLFDIQERITGRIASRVGGEYGEINQARYQAMLDSRPTTVSEQVLLLKHYHHVTVLTDESLAELNAAANEALEANPDSALINAIAGGLYGNIWAFGGPGADEALQEFAQLTERAYVLNPHDQQVVTTLGFKCLAFDERDRFFTLFEQNKDKLANSPLRLGAWAMHMSLFGDWERGKELLDRVFANNLHVPLWLYGTTCLYYYRLHDYESALVEANKFQIPGLFWGPAYRTAVLAQLGRLEEAEMEFETLLEWRPDFKEQGRRLMGCYIRETSLLDHVFEGFTKIGVEIA